MSDLLEMVIAAHGGIDRWNQITRFRANMTVAGAIWTMKHTPGLFGNVLLEGPTNHQYVSITPFGDNGQIATWEPERQTIQNLDGTIVADRPDPAAVFIGTTRQTPWDPLQAAYFASEGNWNYFVSPFVFARNDFHTEELPRWEENGEQWRPLLVTYPNGFVTHCAQQTYYFDDSGMLRRIDYSVDILGGGPAVHYPSEYQTFDGIVVPTKRRVYVRNPDGTPRRASVSIAVDVHNIIFD